MLIEFALVALILYFLLASTVAFGRAVQGSQVVQDAARLASRELAREAFPPGYDLRTALIETQGRIYNPNWLVVDLGRLGGLSIDEFFATLPVVNQALRPAMIFDQQVFADGVRRFLRMPGALLGADPGFESAHDFTVGVPLITGRGERGQESIVWFAVLDEVRPGAFAFDPVAPGNSGLVALRISLPFQASGLSSFRPNPDPDDTRNGNLFNEALDGEVAVVGQPPGVFLPDLVSGFGTYSGPFGLGRQAALGRALRPFRRVVTGQAIFRREVFR